MSTPEDHPVIYHLCSRIDWEGERDGPATAYLGSALARGDGFLHLSCSHQLAASLEKHFTALPGLVLVAVETARLGDALKWEVSRGGQLFPHLYGPLPLSAVIGVDDISLGSDGVHILPPMDAAPRGAL